MKNNNLFIYALLAIVLGFTSCTKDDAIKFSDVTIGLNTPSGLSNYALSDVTLTFNEVNTGIITTATLDAAGKLSTTIPAGSYNVTAEGKITYTQDGTNVESTVKGYKDGVVANGSDLSFSLDLFLSDDKAGLILKEIYFTGSVTPENKPYNGDKYFIIYNNSEDTLYADGLIISEADFLSITKREYTPDVMNEAFTAGSIVMVPGSGEEYPIYPGKQIVIANNAIDHLEYNPNSLDLRDADFEIELISTINVDNPEVTNMISVNGSMVMHNRGFKSYVLARLPEGMTVDQYKTENLYTYSYLNALGNETNSNGYKIPNTYILDAVNLSVEAKFEWILTAPQLDMGWTYCGKVDADATRYGKSVLRKVLTTNPDGRVIYQDTNNSTVDFIPESKPSLQK